MRGDGVAVRLLSPGDGTEGADESYVPLEWVAPDRAYPVRCFIMREKSGMNTLRGAKPQGSPHRETGEAKNLEVQLTHGTHFRCGPAP